MPHAPLSPSEHYSLADELLTRLPFIKESPPPSVAAAETTCLLMAVTHALLANVPDDTYDQIWRLDQRQPPRPEASDD